MSVQSAWLAETGQRIKGKWKKAQEITQRAGKKQYKEVENLGDVLNNIGQVPGLGHVGTALLQSGLFTLGTPAEVVETALGNVAWGADRKKFGVSTAEDEQAFQASLQISYSGRNRRHQMYQAVQDLQQRGALTEEALLDVRNQHAVWWAEMLGQIVFDPLNLIGGGGKAMAQAKRIKQARALWATPDLRASAEIAQELTGLSTRGGQAKAALGLKDRTLAYIAPRMASGMRERVGEEAVQGLQMVFGTASKKIEGNLIAEGVARGTPEFAEQLSLRMGATMDAIGKHWARLASPNIDEVQDAVNVLNQYGLGTVTSSTGGRRVAILLRRIMEGPEGELSDLTSLARKAADEGLPKEIVVQEWTKKAADVLEELIPEGRFERALPIATAKKIIQKRRPLDEVFARLYMGMNLGYAWRNLASNAGIGVVMGWSPYVRGAKIANYFDELGYTVKAAERGIGSVGGAAAMQEVGIGPTTVGLWLGQKGEEWASRSYVYQAHADSVGKLWKDALKQFDFAGLGLDDITTQWLQGRVAAQGKMGLDELVATRASLAKRLGVEGGPPTEGVPPVPVPEGPLGGPPLPTEGVFEPWRQPSQQLVEKLGDMGDEILAEVQEAARLAENSEDLTQRLRALQKGYAEHVEEVIKAVEKADGGLGPAVGTTASEAVQQIVRSDKFGPEDLEELGQSIGKIEDAIRVSRARAFGAAMSSPNSGDWVRYLDEIESTFQAEMKALRKDQLALYGKLDAGEITTSQYTEQLFEAYAQKRAWLDKQYSKVIGEGGGGVGWEITSPQAAVRRELALEAQRQGIPVVVIDGEAVDILKLDEFYRDFGPDVEVIPHREYTKKLNELLETKGKPKKLGQFTDDELFTALNKLREEGGKALLEAPEDLMGHMEELRAVGREMGTELFYPGMTAEPPGWHLWDDLIGSLKDASPEVSKIYRDQVNDALKVLENVQMGKRPPEDLRGVQSLVDEIGRAVEDALDIIPEDMRPYFWHDPATGKRIWASLEDGLVTPPEEVQNMRAIALRRGPDGDIQVARGSMHFGGDEILRGMEDSKTGALRFSEGTAEKATEDMVQFAQDLISQGVDPGTPFQQIVSQRKWEGTLQDVANGAVPSRSDPNVDEMFKALFGDKGLPPKLGDELRGLGARGAKPKKAVWVGEPPHAGDALMWDQTNREIWNLGKSPHPPSPGALDMDDAARALHVETKKGSTRIIARDFTQEEITPLIRDLQEAGIEPSGILFTELNTWDRTGDFVERTMSWDEALTHLAREDRVIAAGEAAAAGKVHWAGLDTLPGAGDAVIWDPQTKRLINGGTTDHMLVRQEFDVGPGAVDMVWSRPPDPIVVRDVTTEQIPDIARALVESGEDPARLIKFREVGTYGAVENVYYGDHTLDEAMRLGEAAPVGAEKVPAWEASQSLMRGEPVRVTRDGILRGPGKEPGAVTFSWRSGEQYDPNTLTLHIPEGTTELAPEVRDNVFQIIQETQRTWGDRVVIEAADPAFERLVKDIATGGVDVQAAKKATKAALKKAVEERPDLDDRVKGLMVEWGIDPQHLPDQTRRLGEFEDYEKVIWDPIGHEIRMIGPDLEHFEATSLFDFGDDALRGGIGDNKHLSIGDQIRPDRLTPDSLPGLGRAIRELGAGDDFPVSLYLQHPDNIYDSFAVETSVGDLIAGKIQPDDLARAVPEEAAALTPLTPEELFGQAMEAVESPAARLENLAKMDDASIEGWKQGHGVIQGNDIQTHVPDTGDVIELFEQAENYTPGSIGVFYTAPAMRGGEEVGTTALAFRFAPDWDPSPETIIAAEDLAREMWERHPGMIFHVQRGAPTEIGEVHQIIQGGDFAELRRALMEGPIPVKEVPGEIVERVADIVEDMIIPGRPGYEPAAVINNIGDVATRTDKGEIWTDAFQLADSNPDYTLVSFYHADPDLDLPNRVTIFGANSFKRTEEIPPLLQQRTLEIVQELKSRFPDLEVTTVAPWHSQTDLLGLPPLEFPPFTGFAEDTGRRIEVTLKEPRGDVLQVVEFDPSVPGSRQVTDVPFEADYVSWENAAMNTITERGFKREPWIRPKPEIPPKGAPIPTAEVAAPTGLSPESIAKRKAILERKLAAKAKKVEKPKVEPKVPKKTKGVAEVDWSYYVDPNTGKEVQVYIPDHRGELSYDEWRAYMDELMERVSETEEGKLVASAVQTLDDPKQVIEVSTTPSIVDATRVGGEEAVKVLDDVIAEVDALSRVPPPPPPKVRIAELPPEFEQFMTQVEDAYMQTQAMASQVAKHARDSALLDYRDRRTFDPILQSIYPWVYWHTRSIPNWMGGLFTNPSFVAKYMRVKAWNRVRNDKDPTIPDWAKDTLVVSPPGYNGSLYLNLEATFNPIQQMLEGFDDPDQEKSAFGKALNQISIFGPAPHPLLMMAYAAERGILHGDTDAARSLGYLAPATRAFSSVTGKVLEPWLWLEDAKTGERVPWTGGAKWDIGKAGRMVGVAEGAGELGSEEAVMAVARQAGPTFEQALEAALRSKRLPALASTLLGLRVTPRADWEKDLTLRSRQYQALKAKIGSSEAAKQTLEDAPWMGTVWMAYDNEKERVSGLAWDVFGRIPPGYNAEDVFYKAGITPEMRDYFYETKGDLAMWDPLDYEAFTRGVINLGEILGGPSKQVAKEWAQARALRSDLYAQAEEFFPGMQEVQDTYWAIANAQGKEQANLYASESGLFDYWDWLSNEIVSEPLLLKYYADEGDSKSAAYALRAQAAEAQWPGVTQKQDTYWTLDKAQRREFLKANPELKEYWDWSKGALDYYTQQIDALRRVAQEGNETELEFLGTRAGQGDKRLNLTQRAVVEAFERKEGPVPTRAAQAPARGPAGATVKPRTTRKGLPTMGTASAVLEAARSR